MNLSLDGEDDIRYLNKEDRDGKRAAQPIREWLEDSMYNGKMRVPYEIATSECKLCFKNSSALYNEILNSLAC